MVVITALCLVYHGLMLNDIREFTNEMNEDRGPDEKFSLFLGYNYVPLIMSILMLIFAIFFLSFAVKETRMTYGYFTAGRYFYGSQPYPPAPDLREHPTHDSSGPRLEPGPGPGPSPSPRYESRDIPPPEHGPPEGRRTPRPQDDYDYGRYQGYTRYEDTGPVYGGEYEHHYEYKGPKKFCVNCGKPIEPNMRGFYCGKCKENMD